MVNVSFGPKGRSAATNEAILCKIHRENTRRRPDLCPFAVWKTGMQQIVLHFLCEKIDDINVAYGKDEQSRGHRWGEGMDLADMKSHKEKVEGVLTTLQLTGMVNRLLRDTMVPEDRIEYVLSRWQQPRNEIPLEQKWRDAEEELLQGMKGEAKGRYAYHSYGGGEKQRGDLSPSEVVVRLEVDAGNEDGGEDEVPLPNKRRKTLPEQDTSSAPLSSPAPAPTRPRGRPRKTPSPSATPSILSKPPLDIQRAFNLPAAQAALCTSDPTKLPGDVMGQLYKRSSEMYKGRGRPKKPLASWIPEVERTLPSIPPEGYIWVCRGDRDERGKLGWDLLRSTHTNQASATPVQNGGGSGGVGDDGGGS
ncbi:hypothetical protein MKZ38_004502 [Zalerion maritima]|uniref:Uncharacterized protein n=1 Tax=Zalerion maritima TaxID=339359 RepID=A0AAD5RLF5_9PEZI|nr:hypothetical protein MKZ38_004502 [Zalerion maritima]